MKIQKNNRGGGGDGGQRVDVNEELKFFVKIQKENFGGGGWVGGGGGFGGQGGCERRSEVFVIIIKKWGGG